MENNDYLSINSFIFLGGFLAALMACGRLIRSLSARNLVMAAFLLSIAFLQCASALFHSRQIREYPDIFLMMAPAVLIAGPLIYLLYRFLFDELFQMNTMHSLHFAPAVILASYLFWSYGDMGELQMIIRRHRDTGDIDEYRLFLICAVLAVLVYVTYCLLRVSWLWKGTKKGTREKLTGLMTAAIYFCFALAALVGLLIYARHLIQAINFGTTLLLITLYLVEQKYPDLLDALAAAVKKRREQSHLRGIDLGHFRKRLLDLMEQEKVFADEDITLPMLADALGVSPHLLSEFLNTQMNRNFNRFVNDFRIREARNLLVEQPTRSILSIGMAVGFNSSSAFHLSFREETGLTPARFRKSVLKNPAIS